MGFINRFAKKAFLSKVVFASLKGDSGSVEPDGKEAYQAWKQHLEELFSDRLDKDRFLEKVENFFKTFFS